MSVLAEVAPLAPLVPMTAVVGCLVALGLLIVARSVVEAFFQVGASLVGWIPWLGRKAANGVHAVEQRLNDRLSQAIDGTADALTWSWHQTAAVSKATGAALLATAQATWHVWWYVNSRYSLPALAVRLAKAAGDSKLTRQIVHALQTRTQTIVKVIEHPRAGPIAVGARAAVRPITAELDWLERWTIPRVKALTRAVAVELPGEIAGLREAGEALARAYDRLRKLVRRHERLLGAGAITAAVALALSRLGGTWIRCTNWRRAGRQVCRMDADYLADLLALTTVIAGSISIVELARALQGVTGEVTDAVDGFIREA